MRGPQPARGRRALQRSEHKALLATGDFLASVAAVAVSLWLWTITAGISVAEAWHARAAWFLLAPVWVVGLTSTRRPHVSSSLPATFRGLTRFTIGLLLAYLVLYFYAPRNALPRLLALYFAWEGALLTLAWRLVYVWLFTGGAFTRRVLILGSGPAGVAIANVLGSDHGGDDVLGFVTRGLAPVDNGGFPVLGGVQDLPQLALQCDASELVLAAPVSTADEVEHLLACEEAGISVVPFTTAYEQALGRVPVAHLSPDWLFTSYAEAVSRKDASRLAKRGVDVVGGLVGSLVLAVVGPIIAVAIWLDSGSPVFYKQERCGRAGRSFLLTKFRTMRQDAEAEGIPRWAAADDARVTRVGRWLRRARLDELPNLLSVLRGDMSLVGPRPERPEFVARLQEAIPLYRARVIVRPGLTGWAQVNVPYGDSVTAAATKLEYDLFYLKYRSVSFDSWILLKTVGTMLSLRGR